MSSLLRHPRHLLRLFPFLCGGYRQFTLRNRALQQQLGVCKTTVYWPKVRRSDGFVCAALSRSRQRWRQALVVWADTVRRWRPRRFRKHRTNLSCRLLGHRDSGDGHASATLSRTWEPWLSRLLAPPASHPPQAPGVPRPLERASAAANRAGALLSHGTLVDDCRGGKREAARRLLIGEGAEESSEARLTTFL